MHYYIYTVLYGLQSQISLTSHSNNVMEDMRVQEIVYDLFHKGLKTLTQPHSYK